MDAERSTAVFTDAAHLIRTFMAQCPANWNAFQARGGFDIVLSRAHDAKQVGIVASMALDDAVLDYMHKAPFGPTPDYLAILVPWGNTNGRLAEAREMGVTVIQMRDRDLYLAERSRYPSGIAPHVKKFSPDLPDGSVYWGVAPEWFEKATTNRIPLPKKAKA